MTLLLASQIFFGLTVLLVLSQVFKSKKKKSGKTTKSATSTTITTTTPTPADHAPVVPAPAHGTTTTTTTVNAPATPAHGDTHTEHTTTVHHHDPADAGSEINYGWWIKFLIILVLLVALYKNWGNLFGKTDTQSTVSSTNVTEVTIKVWSFPSETDSILVYHGKTPWEYKLRPKFRVTVMDCQKSILVTAPGWDRPYLLTGCGRKGKDEVFPPRTGNAKIRAVN